MNNNQQTTLPAFTISKKDDMNEEGKSQVDEIAISPPMFRFKNGRRIPLFCGSQKKGYFCFFVNKEMQETMYVSIPKSYREVDFYYRNLETKQDIQVETNVTGSDLGFKLSINPIRSKIKTENFQLVIKRNGEIIEFPLFVILAYEKDLFYRDEENLFYRDENNYLDETKNESYFCKLPEFYTMKNGTMEEKEYLKDTQNQDVQETANRNFWFLFCLQFAFNNQSCFNYAKKYSSNIDFIRIMTFFPNVLFRRNSSWKYQTLSNWIQECPIKSGNPDDFWKSNILEISKNYASFENPRIKLTPSTGRFFEIENLRMIKKKNQDIKMTNFFNTENLLFAVLNCSSDFPIEGNKKNFPFRFYARDMNLLDIPFYERKEFSMDVNAFGKMKDFENILFFLENTTTNQILPFEIKIAEKRNQKFESTESDENNQSNNNESKKEYLHYFSLSIDLSKIKNEEKTVWNFAFSTTGTERNCIRRTKIYLSEMNFDKDSLWKKLTQNRGELFNESGYRGFEASNIFFYFKSLLLDCDLPKELEMPYKTFNEFWWRLLYEKTNDAFDNTWEKVKNIQETFIKYKELWIDGKIEFFSTSDAKMLCSKQINDFYAFRFTVSVSDEIYIYGKYNGNEISANKYQVSGKNSLEENISNFFNFTSEGNSLKPFIYKREPDVYTNRNAIF